MTGMIEEPRQLLVSLFNSAVETARPRERLIAALPDSPRGRTLVVGAGKAAADMASVVERNWSTTLSGLVIVPFDHDVPTERIEVRQAAHPVPDSSGTRAAREILERVSALGPDDLALCLISGGGSSLMALPAPGVSLDIKKEVTRKLLRSGATIHEMNCVRKHLSAIKGGKLAAAAAPADVVTLLISDVAGDDISVIASGPTVGDPSTRQDAREILDRYRIKYPVSVTRWLDSSESETPKPGDQVFNRSRSKIVATARESLESAADAARQAGLKTVILGDEVTGESREVAKHQAERALGMKPADRPGLILSGGETTVTHQGKGSGGPNQEFLLALAVALDGHPRIHALACDTDGIDGASDAAGACIHPGTLEHAASRGISATHMLERNDSGSFFAALEDQIVTGPTHTNVNDFRAILVT